MEESREKLIYKKNKALERDLNSKASVIVAEHGIEALLRIIGGKNYIRDLATGLTHYAFRQGPIEDMHAGIDPMDATEETDPANISQLSDVDMKILNKYMVDKLGFFLTLLVEERYVELHNLMSYHTQMTDDWDQPDIKKEEREWNKEWKAVLSDENYFFSKDGRSLIGRGAVFFIRDMNLAKKIFFKNNIKKE